MRFFYKNHRLRAVLRRAPSPSWKVESPAFGLMVGCEIPRFAEGWHICRPKKVAPSFSSQAARARLPAAAAAMASGVPCWRAAVQVFHHGAWSEWGGGSLVSPRAVSHREREEVLRLARGSGRPVVSSTMVSRLRLTRVDGTLGARPGRRGRTRRRRPGWLRGRYSAVGSA